MLTSEYLAVRSLICATIDLIIVKVGERLDKQVRITLMLSDVVLNSPDFFAVIPFGLAVRLLVLFLVVKCLTPT